MKMRLVALYVTAVAASCAETYDYIIVGGGTAGPALATRLSLGLPSASILLLEAGPAAWDEPLINIPGNRGSGIRSRYDWNFTSIPQANVDGRVFAYARGKVLGGSSALNLMTYDRASSAEYDAWEELGNEGWNWENMIEAMMKSETFTGKNTPTYGDKGVGDSGPVQAVVNRYIPEQQESFIPTMNSLGIEGNLESLGGDPLGVMFQPNSIDPVPWNRSTAANAYLPLAGSNLCVLTEKTVAKVNLKTVGDSQVATGVTLVDGTVFTASKEVILSAGAIQSPALLEVSGVGQAAVLAAAGVEQKIELPGVGENLQDHMRIQSSYQLKDGYVSFDNIRANATYAAEQMALWKAGETGAYDYAGSGYSFVTWPQALSADPADTLVALAEEAAAADPHPVTAKKVEFLSDATVPQLEVIFSDGYTGVKGYPAATDPLFGNQYITLIAGVMHPLSRGSIHINATNPAGAPVIDPNFFSNEHDVQALVDSIKYCRQVAQTEPLASLWEVEYEPGVATQTDEQWRAFVMSTALSIFHPTGTCAMLPLADGGVVDSDLRVYGAANLRVVDASVMPLLISAHIQTAVYGIAEIAAEKIIAAAA